MLCLQLTSGILNYLERMDNGIIGDRKLTYECKNDPCLFNLVVKLQDKKEIQIFQNQNLKFGVIQYRMLSLIYISMTMDCSLRVTTQKISSLQQPLCPIS